MGIAADDWLFYGYRIFVEFQGEVPTAVTPTILTHSSRNPW